jgi:hypothetical protein
MRFWWYVTKASWRLGRGRWYVWRDTPTDIVRRVAVLWYHARREQYEDVELIRQAHQEYELRKRKKL